MPLAEKKRKTTLGRNFLFGRILRNKETPPRCSISSLEKHGIRNNSHRHHHTISKSLPSGKDILWFKNIFLFASLFACGIHTAKYIHPLYSWLKVEHTHSSCARHFAIRRDQHCRKNIIGEPQQLSLRRVSFKMYSHAGLEKARYILNRVEKRDSREGGPPMKI